MTGGSEVRHMDNQQIRRAAEFLRTQCDISMSTVFVNVPYIYDILKISRNLNFDYEVCEDKKFPISIEAYFTNNVIYVRESVWEAAEKLELFRLTDNKDVSFGQRARFTLAHELGHYVLHADQIEHAHRRRIPSHTSRCSEEQANCFAAHLLISTPVADNFYRNGWFHTEYLVKKFGISKACARKTINRYVKTITDTDSAQK